MNEMIMNILPPGENSLIRCGIVAIVGRANVGKSTLVNAILEEKISIISSVAQTTRNMVRGVFTDSRGQIVFQDTPGIHKASNELGKIMNKQARESIKGCDIIMQVLDTSIAPRQEDEGWMRRLAFESQPLIFVLNKSDQSNPEYVQALRDTWKNVLEEKGVTRDALWLETSAANRDGIDALVQILFDHLPFGPMLFPEEMLTDFPRKIAIADIIREKLFHELHDEIPYAIGVIVETFDEAPEKWTVQADIYVHRHSQKKIVIGVKGRLLRSVKRKAEREISEAYDIPVKLDLWVKVADHWDQNFWLMKKMGYR
ncbi:MAG: GTPase Era [Spartobacteria bacterium]|nr:GTPase Era [Spartobacteria bacterium]